VWALTRMFLIPFIKEIVRKHVIMATFLFFGKKLTPTIAF